MTVLPIDQKATRYGIRLYFVHTKYRVLKCVQFITLKFDSFTINK